MKKILITGHSGYIGSNLWDWLKSDYKLFGIDKPIDLVDCSLSEFIDVDFVIHLASLTGVRESIKNPHQYFSNNILSTTRIFDAYSSTKTKILFASTSAVGELASPYAMSKYACELLKPKNCTIMRFFTVWGGKNYRKNMLYGLSKDDKLEYITNQSRDYTHIDDVCRAVKLIMEKGDSNDLYEVGNGQSIKNVDFLSSIGYTKSLPIKEVTGESSRTCADNTKLKALGW